MSGAERGHVLVVEDEDYVRESLVAMLGARGFQVSAAANAADALGLLERSPIDVVLSDLRMPGVDGLELVRRLGATGSETPIVILTGHGTVGSAVECLKAGAADYVLKPAEPDALDVALSRVLEARALRREVEYLRGDANREASAPIGESDAWRSVVAMVDAAAASDATVLLVGETGTGKEVLARRLHVGSRRARRAFVRVNCAAVPIDLWESEFFGHRKGAFTGAVADRDGRFQLADGGTLLLDEIGTTPLVAQAKLLRVLQEGEVERVGDTQPAHVDVRVVAATNSDLDADVQAGRFRSDLFYRLNVVRIDVPPLRERPDDLGPLVRHFARLVSAELGRPALEPSVELIDRLRAYAWPGNVRELQSLVERALVLDPNRGLEAIDPLGAGPAVAGAGASGDFNLKRMGAALERKLLLDALAQAEGKRTRAARLLGIDPRNLAYYLRKHAIDPDGPGAA